MRSLFGTDGIRGRAGTYPLDDETVGRIGRALAGSLGAGTDRPATVLVGCDTRESSEGIVAALAGGLEAGQARVAFAGVVPTPAVAQLARETGADAGVSVSASHNPWEDNGVKVFAGSGRKLPDEVEAAIEKQIHGAVTAPPAHHVAPDPSLAERYVDHLVSVVPARLDGLKVVIDAAHGAAYRVAPEAFRRAGARVVERNVSPDGRNINAGCGALHPEAMARAVVEEGADLGLALDGDADRSILADGDGQLLDGDEVLYLWAVELEREGRRPGAVVGTVMSNFGLEKALEARGIRLVRAPVGDRYVVEEMERNGAVLGGEPSGHLIRSDLSTTGDGTLTGLLVAAAIASSGVPLARQPRIDRTPQILRNVRVRERVPFESIPGFPRVYRECEELLGRRGRILLRYSGTEALARVMVEGSEREVVERVAASLATALDEAIGAAA